jgi:hypothetical protein
MGPAAAVSLEKKSFGRSKIFSTSWQHAREPLPNSAAPVQFRYSKKEQAS